MTVTDFPSVSVIIPAFAMERWDTLREAVSSVQAQPLENLETIVVIDHNSALFTRAQNEFVGATVVPNISSRGASGARNSGAAVAKGELIAFIDDDAVASPDWLEVLLQHLANPDVVGVGGKIIPLWENSRPRWFPSEFDWVVGTSYLGMPESAIPIRNVWSNNMAIKRQAFNVIGGFRDGFGKVGTRNRPEDTDLCLRAAEASAGKVWIYEPAAVVGHHIPTNRAKLGYFLRRCLNEGLGKASLAALNGAAESTSAERYYTRHVLPRGVICGLRDARHGDASGGLRSAAIVTGLCCAAAGFLAGRITYTSHASVLSRARAGRRTGQVRWKGASDANSS
jgi:GT2 family glycosyltransferase